MLDPVFVKLIVVLTRLYSCQSKQTSYDKDDPNVNSVNPCDVMHIVECLTQFVVYLSFVSVCLNPKSAMR